MDDDLAARHLAGPVDDAAAQRLRTIGLDLRRVAPQRPELDGWQQATARGFLDAERTPEQLEASLGRAGYRRFLGVYDPSGPMTEVPVGTFASWVGELTLPGGALLPTAAISAVTVAPTHQGRGIARAMMEGELRYAASLGVPMAALTVSESTLYGRYGFAPATAAATWVIDAKRARWTGPVAPGRVDFVTREDARRLAPEVHERVRVSRPGELAVPEVHWGRFTGTDADADKPGGVRAVRYADQSGNARGVATYTVHENHDDYTKSSVRVLALIADGDEAYAGLWRYFLQLPLVGTVTATELSTDEPLLWMISDQRAATVTVTDHHYVRVLDVPTVLRARRYAGAGRLVLEVTDPLGIGGGSWLVQTEAGGPARVEPVVGGQDADAPVVSLGTTELSAIVLGGVSLATLAAAGRVRATDAAAAASVFAWPVAPRLSFWY
ncbi:GNAT family N-acetyltransferase [Microbacterium terrisoli]|jgi:predicted acetyltransferase|uniref:GNAT family N-acetyltransferase n=1 Tax=Microbacterium terrisoli TaxID=3242192 RepID=UPI00280401FF|nr:GNAT family N-acetyltransferase [Microbacterium protaetiae]